MGAMKRKLHSRSGATLLMALLLLLVAVMVSTVIISAANTATSSLKTRRDNQQAYLTVSSAAEYLRDALLEEDGYSRSFVRHYKGDPDNEENFDKEKGEEPGATTDRKGNSIAQTVDGLLGKVLGGPSSSDVFIHGIAPEQTYVLQYADLTPVTVALKLEEQNGPEQDPQTPRYLLTAEFSTADDSEALCRMTLQMYCEIRRDSVPSENKKTKTVTYQAVWQRDAAVILRQGMLKEEMP